MPKKASSTYNLAVERPDLMKIWSPQNTTSPYEVAPKARAKALWQCKCGFEWIAEIRQVAKGSGKCRKCASNRATDSNNFAVTFPEKVKLWSPQNNFGPEEVTPNSTKKAWWICENRHEWQTVVYSVAKGTGCPYCSNQKIDATNSFAAAHPQIAKFWDYKMNNGITPDRVSPGSAKRKYWFICENNHSFDITLNNIHSLNRWCPYCAGKKPTDENNLALVNPELAAEWHPTKNKKKPNDFLPNSNQKAWWKCSRSHEWQAVIGSRNIGNGCPKCANRELSDTNSLAVMFPEIAVEYDVKKNRQKDPSKVLAGSGKRVWWKCKYGHSWLVPVKNRTHSNTGCPECSPQSSFHEIRLYCETLAISNKVEKRSKVDGVEIDVWLPKLKLAIEYDGAYYHAKQRQKDKEKNKKLEKLGITVVRIREMPLTAISKNDFIIKASANILKPVIDDFFRHLADIRPELRAKVEKYVNKNSFVNESLFNELVSYLPGPGPELSLATLNPRVAKEWHKKLNAPLKPEMFHIRSGKRVWWLCAKGHEWEATIDKRGSGQNCPFCSGRRVHPDNCLATLDPEIAALWYQPQNEITPHDVTRKSGKKVWFRCHNGHFTFTSVASKVKARGCSHCPGIGKNKKYTPPDFEDEWR